MTGGKGSLMGQFDIELPSEVVECLSNMGWGKTFCEPSTQFVEVQWEERKREIGILVWLQSYDNSTCK